MSRNKFFFLAIPIALTVFLSSVGISHASGGGIGRTGTGDDTTALEIAQKTDTNTPPADTTPPAGGSGEDNRKVKVTPDITTPANPTPPASGAGQNPSGALGNQRNDATFTPTGLTLPEFLERINGIFDGIVPFIIGLTVFFIIWKIVVYIIHAGEEEKRTEAKHFVLWGIIAIFCMLSIWGFVTILLNSFELDTVIDTEDIPTVPLIEAPTR